MAGTFWLTSSVGLLRNATRPPSVCICLGITLGHISVWTAARLALTRYRIEYSVGSVDNHGIRRERCGHSASRHDMV